MVTVFQFLEHLSDRQAADAVRARIDWRSALGLELTDPGFHCSVLTEFRARLVAKGAEHLLLDRMLERFKARGLVKARGKQRTDGPHVLAAVHEGRPRWRAGSELPPVGERLQSPYDPQAHCSTKRQGERSGDKVPLTETCDESAAHLVTHVMTCPAMQQDMTGTAAIHGCLAAKDLLPAEHSVASAYVDAALLVGSQRDHGISLEGPVRGVANQYARGPGFEQRDFAIGWDGERVPRPQGKTPVTWRAGRDEAGAPRIQALFSRTGCGACDVRAQCTPSKDARRSLSFHPRPEYEALNAARTRMHDPTWKERYRARAGIEGTPSQGVRAFGLRRSRSIGLAKTGLQQACTAAAMTVSRIVNWLDKKPRAKPRVTRFTAPAQTA